MANFANRVAGLRSLATSRLDGTTWVLNGTEVVARFISRYSGVAFGDERYKNVDMTGVGINSKLPVLRLPEVDFPEDFGRGDEAYDKADPDSTYVVVSVEKNNGMVTVRLKNEA